MTKSHWAEVCVFISWYISMMIGISNSFDKREGKGEGKKGACLYFLLLCRVLFQCTVICLQLNELLCKSDLFSSNCVSSTFRV